MIIVNLVVLLLTLPFIAIAHNYGALSAVTVENFEASINGSVITKKHWFAYKHEKRLWIQNRIKTEPMGIFLPKTIQDVSDVVKFCRLHGIYPRIKSGGHSMAAFSQTNVSGPSYCPIMLISECARMNGSFRWPNSRKSN